jgi:hypothetical protein
MVYVAAVGSHSGAVAGVSCRFVFGARRGSAAQSGEVGYGRVDFRGAAVWRRARARLRFEWHGYRLSLKECGFYFQFS